MACVEAVRDSWLDPEKSQARMQGTDQPRQWGDGGWTMCHVQVVVKLKANRERVENELRTINCHRNWYWAIDDCYSVLCVDALS